MIEGEILQCEYSCRLSHRLSVSQQVPVLGRRSCFYFPPTSGSSACAAHPALSTQLFLLLTHLSVVPVDELLTLILHADNTKTTFRRPVVEAFSSIQGQHPSMHTTLIGIDHFYRDRDRAPISLCNGCRLGPALQRSHRREA
jgi:hypothetical protein